MPAAAAPARPIDRLTRRLLVAGAVAGPLYVGVATTQILAREGFDVRRHAVSLLANGDWGSVQIANFLVAGALVLAGAIGLRRRISGERGGTWAPLLLALHGVGLIGAGLFVADPGGGFPPGAAAPDGGMTTTGLLHFAFGGVAFYALIGACLVMARRFRGLERRGWALWSFGTGIVVLVAFGTISTGALSPVAVLGLYAAVLLGWVWHCAVMATAARESRTLRTP